MGTLLHLKQLGEVGLNNLKPLSLKLCAVCISKFIIQYFKDSSSFLLIQHQLHLALFSNGGVVTQVMRFIYSVCFYLLQQRSTNIFYLNHWFPSSSFTKTSYFS